MLVYYYYSSDIDYVGSLLLDTNLGQVACIEFDVKLLSKITKP